MYGLNGTAGEDAAYSGYFLTRRAVDIIRDHGEIIRAHGEITQSDHQGAIAPPAPLFLYLALHNTHAPIEAPQRFVDMYSSSFGNDTLRQVRSGQVRSDQARSAKRGQKVR